MRALQEEPRMKWTRPVLTVAMLWVLGGAPVRRPGSAGEESSPRQRGRHPCRHGPLPRAVRRLPRHGRARRPGARHHAGVGVGPDRRWPVQDDQGRRAWHRDAGQPAHQRPGSVADPRVPAHAGRPGPDRSTARQRPERRSDLPAAMRRLSSGERHRAGAWDPTCLASASRDRATC